MIVRKSREEKSDTSWNINSRDRYKTKSRKYALGSFFTTVLTAITDPKDWKGIKIKCDPAYLHDSDYKARVEAD